MAGLFDTIFGGANSTPLPTPDPRTSPFGANGLMRPPTYSDMFGYMRRNPSLRQPALDYLMQPYVKTTPEQDQKAMNNYLAQSVAIADPFGIAAIQRMLGYQPTQQFLINEAHGLANKENDRFRYNGY